MELKPAASARRKLYEEERRDPYVIELIDKAIEEMEATGSLASLSDGERAALQSHTRSVVGDGAPAKPDRVGWHSDHD